MADSLVHDREAASAAQRYFFTRILIYGLLVLFALIYLVPLVVVVMNTFRDNIDVARNGLISFPRSFTRAASWPT